MVLSKFLLSVLGLTVLKNDSNPYVDDDECLPDRFRCADHFECCSKYCYKPIAWINPFKGWCFDEQILEEEEQESEEQGNFYGIRITPLHAYSPTGNFTGIFFFFFLDNSDGDCLYIDYKCKNDNECCSLNCTRGKYGTKRHGTCEISDTTYENSLSNYQSKI